MGKRSEPAKEVSARCCRLGNIAAGWIHSPVQSFHSEAQAAKYARAAARLALRLHPSLREPRKLPELSAEDRRRAVIQGHYQWRGSSLIPRE